MKHITIIFTFLLICLTFQANAQEAKLKKGKKYYEFYNYYKSIEKYEVLQDKTFEIKKELAYSYFFTGQYQKAEQYFIEILNDQNSNIDDIYTLVKVLMINQKYEDALQWMDKFKQLAPNDKRAELFSSNKGFYNELSQDKGYFSIKNIDFNNESQEFSPVFYTPNKVIFSSTRTLVEPIKRRWTWNNMPFLNFYIANIDTTNLEFIDFELFSFNKKFHEGTVSFNKTGDFMVFTTNNYKSKSSDGIIKLMMFESTYKDGKWQKPVAFTYNNADYSVGHPSLTEDGKILFFASDMPGGKGGVDIYYSLRNNDGQWSKPVNILQLNTEANEMFPFIHKNGYLFFASDGRPGLGGLDLFAAKIDNFEVSNIMNLGAPVNTNFDDFAMVFNDEMTSGYFCSNRTSGKGSDDIYSFKLLVPIFSQIILRGITVDTKDSILTNVSVSLFDENNNLLDKVTSNENGKFEFKVERSKNYNLDGIKINYLDGKSSVGTFGSNSVYFTKLILEPVPDFYLVGTVQDDQTKELIVDVSVTLKDISNDKILRFTTDANGSFADELDNIKLNDNVKYTIDIKKEGYLPFSRNFEILYNRPGKYIINDYLKIELHKLNVGEDIAKALQVGPIYFDLNKYNIRPDAAFELDKIVKVMNEYPSLEIELGSHTDCRGSDASNFTLSDNRAKSSANYIKQRITNPNRIYGKGYGETTPKVVTKEINEQFLFLPVGQQLTEKFIYSLPTKEQQEAAHQLNRRTEFKIIKY